MLLDHFHPPLENRRHWTGFHSRWAGNIAVDLNCQLPEGWFAVPTVHWGIEVDVATFEETEAFVNSPAGSESIAWDSPSPLKTIEFPLTTDVVEVQVYQDFGGTPLVGVVELVSPANKDRPENREIFVSKCASYLSHAIGLVLLDIVTDRHANLHSLLMERFDKTDLPDECLYTAAYRPVRRDKHDGLDICYESMRLGGKLPSMPLFLKDGPKLRVNFADTYQQTCEELRIPRSLRPQPRDDH